MELYEAPEIFERVIHYNEVKEIQVRLTISTFKGIEYLSLREYYLSFEEEWCPTPKGVSFPVDFTNSKELFIGLAEILSLAESREVLEEHFSDVINQVYQK